jgi:SAM-dependent methyltransferase
MTTTDKNLRLERSYWDTFYRTWMTSVPSQFGVLVATESGVRQTVLEFGSGNGRDALFFASQGHRVVAMDISSEAIDRCDEVKRSHDFRHAGFLCGDITSARSMEEIFEAGRALAHQDHPALALYSRFVVHTLDEEQETRFLSNLSRLALPSERVYFEFRSTRDRSTVKHFGEHYRRYVDADAFVAELEGRYGFEVVYSITGQGMAKFKEEDPFVTRVIAVKS